MIIYDKNIINLIDFADKMKDNVYNKMIWVSKDQMPYRASTNDILTFWRWYYKIRKRVNRQVEKWKRVIRFPKT